jgi:chaperonin GroEL
METDPIQHQAVMEDAAILISDISVTNMQQIIPVLELAAGAKIPRLVLVTLNMSSEAIAVLVHNKQAKVIDTLAVRTPAIGDLDQMAALEDLAVLTGGRYFCQAAGQTLDHIRLEDLGRLRRAWATDDKFGIVGGKGDQHQLRQHIQTIRSQFTDAEGDQKEKLQERLGRLIGGTAMLYIGGHTETEIKTRMEVAKRTVVTLRAVLDGGVVPGGGVALLNCQPVLQQAVREAGLDDPDRRAALLILKRALEAPIRTIADNAGFTPDTIVDKVRQSQPGFGLDVLSGQVVDMRAASILDPASVLEKAITVAVHTAATALTTDVIIHRRRPPEQVEP